MATKAFGLGTIKSGVATICYLKWFVSIIK